MLSAAISSNRLAGGDIYGSLGKIILDFDQVLLIEAANEDDDSIGITVEQTSGLGYGGGVDVSHREPWNRLIGKPFGWGWLTVNQQGYCDGLLLSFGGIVPQIVLNVMASSIKVGTILEASEATEYPEARPSGILRPRAHSPIPQAE